MIIPKTPSKISIDYNNIKNLLMIYNHYTLEIDLKHSTDIIIFSNSPTYKEEVVILNKVGKLEKYRCK